MDDIIKTKAKEIAQTILKQMGGNKFITMTGAKVSYSLNENDQPVLICNLPSNFAKNGINLFMNAKSLSNPFLERVLIYLFFAFETL